MCHHDISRYRRRLRELHHIAQVPLRSARDSPSAAVRTAGASRAVSIRFAQPVIEIAATPCPLASRTGAAVQAISTVDSSCS